MSKFVILSIVFLSLRLLLRKIHLPRQREAKPHLTIFIIHRLTSIEPRDYRVVFIIQKTAKALPWLLLFIWIWIVG